MNFVRWWCRKVTVWDCGHTVFRLCYGVVFMPRLLAPVTLKRADNRFPFDRADRGLDRDADGRDCGGGRKADGRDCGGGRKADGRENHRSGLRALLIVLE